MSVLLATVERVGLATVQDGGRPGLGSLGVPRAGAVHRLRYLTATALLAGTPDGALPAVEILAGALLVTAERDLTVAIVGPARVEVDSRPAANGTVMHVARSAALAITPAGQGPVYLVVDGWTAPRTLGSASVDTFSRLGGGPVLAGSQLRGAQSAGGAGRVGAFHRPIPDATGSIRVVPTGHGSFDEFAAASWEVTSAARSGVRLRTAVVRAPRESIASQPMVPGAVQLAPSGEAIVLGPDGALTGGYPVVCVVASVDADRVSILRPGDDVAFAPVGVDEAARAYRARMTEARRAVVHPTDLR